ncbi:AraC family transcriptional regulator [Sinomicrobium pectinilyticum]|uniref:AraC family transcriptional regulator n=1 Tax=Sinomicrobium pectinilyticum TaxID=1084421 RepID=A0A3N0DIM6_SINP1|nr:AraC family transcriptional regulator [Sinomicrobium pectinilyticum]RNL75246.1 AraC family transcriptional regulator [Sinomicrobium pectinilyticum]
MDLHFLHKNLETNFKVSLHREREFLKLWHYHPEYELVYISKGRGTVYTGDYIGPYQPGNIFLIGSHLPHMFETSTVGPASGDEGISEAYVVHFGDKFIRGFYENSIEFGYITSLIKESVTGLSFSSPGKKVYKIFQKTTSGNIQENTLHFLRILYYLQQKKKIQLATPAWIDQFNSGDKKLNKVLQYIMLHFQEELSLTEISSYAGMNKTAFCRYFKMKTGKSFVEFLNDLRVSFACKTLLEKNISRSISDICYASGFNSLSYFHRIFKRSKGVAPSEYRGG